MPVNTADIKFGDKVTVSATVDEIRGDAMFIKIDGDRGKRAFVKKTFALTHDSVNILKGDTVYDSDGEALQVVAMEFDSVKGDDILLVREAGGQISTRDGKDALREKPSR